MYEGTCNDVKCPSCGTEFYPYDHEIPIVYPTKEEIEAQEIVHRHSKAVMLWELRSLDPDSYRSLRKTWWGSRIYRQIGKKSAEWAEKALLKNAQPMTSLFDRFVKEREKSL